jgi:hypothetical protein
VTSAALKVSITVSIGNHAPSVVTSRFRDRSTATCATAHVKLSVHSVRVNEPGINC